MGVCEGCKKDYNVLGQPGRIAHDPPLLVRFKGETYGSLYGDGDVIFLGLTHDNSVPISEIDKYVEENKNELVTITLAATGKSGTIKFSDLAKTNKKNYVPWNRFVKKLKGA